MLLIEIINAELLKKQLMLDEAFETINLVVIELYGLLLVSTRNVSFESLLTCLSFTMALFHIQSLKKIPNEQTYAYNSTASGAIYNSRH